MTREQESDLINRAQTGSVAAYEQIVQHYQRRLLRFLMLRGMQRVDAEDATQTAFINAWQNLAGYNSKWRFSTWLYRIAQRCAVPAKALPDGHAELVSPTLDPCLDEQLRHNVWSIARNHLEPQVFQALWLHHGEGFSGAETARILNRSGVWVRVTLHRARARLRDLLNDTEAKAKKKHEHITL